MEAEKIIAERGGDKSNKLYLIDDTDSEIRAVDFLLGQSGLFEQRRNVYVTALRILVGDTGEHARAASSRTWSLFPCRACHRYNSGQRWQCVTITRPTEESYIPGCVNLSFALD